MLRDVPSYVGTHVLELPFVNRSVDVQNLLPLWEHFVKRLDFQNLLPFWDFSRTMEKVTSLIPSLFHFLHMRDSGPI